MSDQNELLRQMEKLLNANTQAIIPQVQGLVPMNSVSWECSVEVGPDGKPVVKCKIGGNF